MFFFINILKSIVEIAKSIKVKLNLFTKVLFLTISSVLELVSIALVIPTLLAFFNQDKFLEIIKNFTSLSSQNIFNIFIIVLLLFFLFKSLIVTLINNYYLKFVFKFQSKLSKTLFNTYVNLDYENYTGFNSGKLIKNISTESRMFAFILINFFQLYSEVIFLLLIITFLFIVNYKIMLFVLLFTTILIVSAFLIFRKRLSVISKLRVENEFGFFKSIKETFENFKLIKIDLKENFFQKKFSSYSDLNSRYTFKQTFLSQIPKIWIEFIAILILFTGLFIFQIRNVNFNIETVMLLGVYGAAFLKVLPSINRVIYSFQFLTNNSATVNLIINELRNFNEKKDYFQKREKNKIIENSEFNFDEIIELKNISFKYRNEKKFIFQNLNLKIKKNSIIGIYGESGIGKTTFIDLISGLLKPSKGTIEVDGTNISENLESWKKNISYVTQSVTVVDDRIDRNIAFGYEDDQIDQNKISKSKKIAELEKLDSFEKNKFIIGESGSNISGGQLQRIGIARGAYKDTNLLIFDEPTSSLDNVTTKKIMSNIFKLFDNKTIIIISHNMKIIDLCEFRYEIKNLQINQININS